jgi:N-sulfoglucosamine sulfohydrolase
VDTEHLVSTLDFTPTLLDATRVTMIPDMDGRTFLPALKGQRMTGWDRVYTFYNQGGTSHWMPMRCVRTKDRAYIWNGWSDGKTEYQGGLFSEKGPIAKGTGLAWPAIVKAAQTNPTIKARVELLVHRVPEEFFDLRSDRFERHNLIADPSSQKEIEVMRSDLLSLMQRTSDPFAEALAHRNDRTVYLAARDRVNGEFNKPAPKKKASNAAKE